MKNNRTRLIVLAVLSLAMIASGMGRKEKSKPKVQTGVKGKVEIYEGNFMPMVDPKSGSGGKITPGAGRKVRLHEPVTSQGLARPLHDAVPTKLIAEATCDENGEFTIEAPAGKYSIFVEEGGGWYYNGFDGEGVQGGIVVEAGKLAEITIKVTTKATF